MQGNVIVVGTNVIEVATQLSCCNCNGMRRADLGIQIGDGALFGWSREVAGSVSRRVLPGTPVRRDRD